MEEVKKEEEKIEGTDGSFNGVDEKKRKLQKNYGRIEQ